MIRQVDREHINGCNYSTLMRYTQQFESKMIANIPSLQVLLLLLSQLFLTDAQAQMTRRKLSVILVHMHMQKSLI